MTGTKRARAARRALPRWTGRAAVGLMLLAAAEPLRGQATSGGAVPVGPEVFVGSELERYLRVLQVAGHAPRLPWSIRPFSPRDLDRLQPADSAHPWAQRFRLGREPGRGVSAALIRTESEVIYNSAFPQGSNDGVVWAGRGITTVVSTGFAAQAGPVSLVVAPVAFWAQNAEFALHPGSDSVVPYRDPLYPTSIDQPQRFGDEPYARIDPGETTLRFDSRYVAAGLSTASQAWGPMTEHPLLLGNHAGGFPHLFVGTGSPLDLWVARLHAKLVWGQLAHSDYAYLREEGSRRMAGLAVVVEPRGLSGLELGVGRFFHVPWDEYRSTSEFLLLPLQVFLKKGLERPGEDPTDATNQIASAFARWTWPAAGFELFGEFVREDHNYDLRDFLLQPDHDSGYALGFQKVWATSESRFTALRAEVMNARETHLTLVRQQRPLYRHRLVTQGHTHHGQVLASAAGFGGAGSIVSLDFYGPRGRWGGYWSRILRQSASAAPEINPGEGADVVHSIGLETILFTRALEWTAGVVGVYELNRYLEDDAFNLGARLGLRVRPGMVSSPPR